ncbi:hypothetical protein N7520_007642 [Penicillium odoratum]|uniref:uncharacterized protein n=1 Tax=Penicillium odoratum TaxID=1167516 RepID=UPI0025472F36|nr:uncharacterized protein N7520_007642 [Penicillium odoratum]KAJ5760486.1 hypothetical protein N7520_007642 [Penicillium odoratum]
MPQLCLVYSKDIETGGFGLIRLLKGCVFQIVKSLTINGSLISIKHTGIFKGLEEWVFLEKMSRWCVIVYEKCLVSVESSWIKSRRLI